MAFATVANLGALNRSAIAGKEHRALPGAVAESMPFARRVRYLMASTSKSSLPLFAQVKASGTTVGQTGVYRHVLAFPPQAIVTVQEL